MDGEELAIPSTSRSQPKSLPGLPPTTRPQSILGPVPAHQPATRKTGFTKDIRNLGTYRQNAPSAGMLRIGNYGTRSSTAPKTHPIKDEVSRKSKEIINKSGGMGGKFDPRRRRPHQTQQEMLQAVIDCDDKDILGRINEKREFFVNLFKTPTATKPDIFTLIFKILSKICRSSYDDVKLKLMISVCNESFVMQLRNYLTDLPDDVVKSRNSLYWNNQNEFWQNFLIFCDTIVNLSPSVALKMYRPLICKGSTNCLNDLNTKHGFKLPDEDTQKLYLLQEKLSQYEKQHVNEKINDKKTIHDNMDEPPENFRELPIIPDHHHLMRRPYLRPNLVDGGYDDVEHYLDVQFRLLQEDCYGPLRKGILQYLEDPTRGKFDNIRVYKNVTFRGPYVSESKVGLIVAVEKRSNKRFFTIKWATSKRLLYGSLVVISKDNFRRFVVATVLDRDEKLLSRGLLPICIVNNDYGDNLTGDDIYTLIESEVYFEPYYHVLKVLQHHRFPQHLAMKDYIIKAQPLTKPPSYLTDATDYVVPTKDDMEIADVAHFTVLDNETWPSAAQLGLNQSQYDAYKLALTHEFTVIQGPPGTGKTFIGTKIAQTLLVNLKRSMLVVCYTNHALDQFLESILPFTDSIARVGNRSKNKAMEELSLQKWRNRIRNIPSYSLYRDEKQNFQRIVNRMKRLQEYIDSLDTGLLCYSSIAPYLQESRILQQIYTNSRSDIITDWLFEHMPITNLTLDEERDASNVDVNETPQRARINFEEDLENDIVQDDDDDDISLQHTFRLDHAHNRLKSLISSSKHQAEDIRNLGTESAVLRSKIRFFKDMKNKYDGRIYTLRGKSAQRMSNEERWFTYFSWTKVILNRIQQKFNQLYVVYERESKSYEDARMNWDREVLQHVKVIGMTTTGAARMHKTVKELSPSIVIVEEAAEVLEQHIVSSLTANCKHLILIGDHQQLRPSAAYMKLAKDYNIEISLFERMIRNNVSNKRLNVQHRMRPEIASLIVPHIYQDLQNHPHVENKPHIRGVLHNVYFLTHNFMEQEMDEGSSRTNKDEADIALGLANYLMQQDYAPEDITILAAYSGQMFYMRKQRNLYRHLSEVKITVVDNYQGEESKIIILSLVRNNLENKIGFLSTENRVCVALSRAKEGFFMLGNMDILRKNVGLWEKIAITLENMDSLGNGLRLKCEVHPNQLTTIEAVQDFEKVPEGGCLQKCGYVLDCKHECPQLCHSYDRAHKNIPCTQKCERVLCELNHVCPKMCKEECGGCMVSVQKKLPCGHDKYVPCHLDPSHKSVHCKVAVDVTLPHCEHKMKKPCYQDVSLVKCIFKCEYRVQSCGHVCMLSCHVTRDPDHEEYTCRKPCPKAKKNCTANLLGDRGQHQCPKMCYEACVECNVEVLKKRSTCKHAKMVACSVNIDITPCREKCARIMACGHFCLKKCYEQCGDCSTKIKKTIPGCNHEVMLECDRDPARADCTRRCERTRPCGHPCPGQCRDPCDQTTCRATSTTTVLSPCGHRVTLMCSIASQWATLDKPDQDEILLQNCNAPCNQTLKCEHVCPGTCSQCLQGRIHVSCTQPCQKINICGHSCEEPCSRVCPPCKKPCEFRCDHSKCNKPCGSPCSPCQEKCSRACPHSSCARRCGEPCSRRACAAACPRALPCGHACRGLCGEPCPDICNLCRPDSFPKDFLGDDFEDDARFVQLQDCPHVLEVNDMDCLMSGDSATIAIRTCPFITCRTAIINTYRYKDLINEQFKTDINRIKQQIFGGAHRIKKKIEECNEAVQKLPKVVWTVNKMYRKAKNVGIPRHRNASLLDLEMKLVYFNILDIIGEYYLTYVNENLNFIETEFLKRVDVICQSLIKNCKKVSEQFQSDINEELKRLASLIKLGQVVKHPTYAMCHKEPAIVEALAVAKTAILSWHVFNSITAELSIESLQAKLKQSNTVVSQRERAMVVKAMGMAMGHWFKCPNNHYYYIGDCGGATQIGKCNECGEKVGGTGHRLLPTNSHAGEMDNSQHPAWSEQNNMLNYRI